MTGLIANFVDSQMRPTRHIDPDLLLKWFNTDNNEPVTDVSEVSTELYQTKRLFKLMIKDKSGLPEFIYD